MPNVTQAIKNAVNNDEQKIRDGISAVWGKQANDHQITVYLPEMADRGAWKGQKLDQVIFRISDLMTDMFSFTLANDNCVLNLPGDTPKKGESKKYKHIVCTALTSHFLLGDLADLAQLKRELEEFRWYCEGYVIQIDQHIYFNKF